MYNIGICDDGKNICTSIENMLLKYAQKKNIQVDTNVWYTGESLRNYLASGGYLDILFLDIELFKMTGIVYISGKESYAQQLFKTQPLDFLIKPIEQEQIHEVMDMALKIVKKRNERFEFQQGKNYYYISMGDIVYFGSERRKVKVVTMKAAYEFYGKLKEVAKCLSEDFIMIHQSYVINKEYVFRYTYETVELIDGTILTISLANRKLVRDKLLKEESYA